MAATAEHTGLTLTLAINYGGRDEIVRGINKMISELINPLPYEGRAGVGSGTVTEEKFSSFLDTAGMPDVDLVIRTAGDQRLSNFLPWQTTYAELYFTDVKWPAFSDHDLDIAIAWFEDQKRNGGK
jgi:undecaprenyl diphosphate synthase